MGGGGGGRKGRREERGKRERGIEGYNPPPPRSVGSVSSSSDETKTRVPERYRLVDVKDLKIAGNLSPPSPTSSPLGPVAPSAFGDLPACRVQMSAHVIIPPYYWRMSSVNFVEIAPPVT